MKILRSARHELNMLVMDPASYWSCPGLFRYT
jgi:hypothetical protein